MAKRNRAVKAVVKEVNDLEAVGRAVPEVNDLEAVGRVVPVDAVPVGVAPEGVARVAPVAGVTMAHSTSRRMNFPGKSWASTVRPRSSRAAAVLASVPQWLWETRRAVWAWGRARPIRLPTVFARPPRTPEPALWM